MLEKLRRLKYTLAFTAALVLIAAFLVRSGSLVFALFTLPLAVWIAMIYILEEVGENFAVLQIVNPKDGVVSSVSGLIRRIEELKNGEGFVVETDKFTVVSPFLAKGKTSFMLGLPEVYVFTATLDSVEEDEGKIKTVVNCFSAEEANAIARRLAESYAKAKKELRNSYSKQYVRALEEQVEKLREQFEKGVLMGVKALEGVKVDDFVRNPTFLIIAVALFAVGLLLGVVLW